MAARSSIMMAAARSTSHATREHMREHRSACCGPDTAEPMRVKGRSADARAARTRVSAQHTASQTRLGTRTVPARRSRGQSISSWPGSAPAGSAPGSGQRGQRRAK
eukprot:2103168-Rhodomonas_salina.1